MRTLALITLVLAGCSGPAAPPDDTGTPLDASMHDAGALADTGACTSAADCPSPSSECSRASCSAGRCGVMPAPNGTTCDDGDACTATDVCTSGTCGGAPVVCPDVSACVAGACRDNVFERNHHPTRDGHYVQPAFTHVASATIHRDTTFAPAFSGHVYAQPLYVADGPGGRGIVIVATESNDVFAIAESDGSMVWMRSLGTAATTTGAGCGNISPLGVTGTPVIDPASRTMYLDAAIANATSTIATHEIHALSIDDGTERAGWPVDTATITAGALAFNPVVQNQRGALALIDGVLYVPYGGHAGDCNNYRGWVIGVPVADPAHPVGWATAASRGGIWAPGGLSSDGTDVFASTGNTYDVGGAPTVWSQGEAILRFHGLPAFTGATTDFFTPSNWSALDVVDEDLGGSGPLLIDVPGATPSALVVALGKNGVAYLLDRRNLGGIGTGNGTTGEGLASRPVANTFIVTAGATYTTAMASYVVFTTVAGASGVGCPGLQSGNMIALRIGAASPPTIEVAWCVNPQGRGSPMVTTIDGRADPVVWVVGDTSQRLRGYDGDTGTEIYAGGGASDTIANVHYFQTPIAVNGRIYVAGHDALYRFTP